MYKFFIKRLLDLGISFIVIICISPVLLIVTILLFFANKGAGVFFLQERPGMNEKIFKVIKFKTMTDDCDSDGNLLPDVQRLTKIGNFFRSISVDELPQLINVLKGDMALVGPRPLLPQYLPMYSSKQRRRHEVRPGITGWAQVHGRNLLKLSKKFEYDVWYVDHCSFVLDCKILWITIVRVLKREAVGNGAMDMDVVDDLGFMDRINKLGIKN